MLRVGLALGLAVWLGVSQAAAPAADLQNRQADAQAQQARLRERIQSLQKDINRQEASRQDAATALKTSESAISDIDRRLEELAQQQADTESELKRLEQQVSKQERVLEQRRHELAEQLRAQYASGLSPWTALLSGDDPQEIGRELGYLGYVSRAQATAVKAVEESLQTLAVLRKQSHAHRQQLTALANETKAKRVELDEQKQERQRVLAKISDQLKAQRAQADTLQRDEQRLTQLISGLEQAIAKQVEEARLAELRRREEARRQEEQRRLAALQAQQERERREEEARKVARSQEEAHRARVQVEQAREQERARRQAEQQQADQQSAPAQVASAAPMQGLRQGLPFPVRGQVQGRFGAERPDGGVWRGVVVRAQEGTRVNAIAPGRVVYADWLNGFGNILILDHGAQYLSVYAYNQSLLKQVGQTVASGEAIATVGATGGQVESGLYFEIRHQGKPVNPLLWLAR